MSIRAIASHRFPRWLTLPLAALVAVALPAPVSAAAGVIIRQQLPPSANSDIGTTRIVVDGPSDLGYTEVTSKSLDVWVSVALEKPTSHAGFDGLTIDVEGTSIDGEVTYATRRYKLTIPYVGPRSGSVANQRVSAVDRCNAALEKAKGPARDKFIAKGALLTATNAYRLRAVATHPGEPVKKKKRGTFPDAPQLPDDVTVEAEAFADAEIQCLALGRPRPRTQTSTQGVDPKPGKKMEPTIKAASLRIEPAGKQTIAHQHCPTQLRLVGHVETIRAFDGQAIFFGEGFLSPITKLELKGAGNRSYVATYPLRWDEIGGLAGAAPSGPMKQTVTLRMNVTNTENKVLEARSETIEVACKPIRATGGSGAAAEAAQVTAAAVDPQMWSWHESARLAAAAPGRAVASKPDLDVRIRRVDRLGPDGATQLWLYNAGATPAKQCRLDVRKSGAADWYRITLVDVAPKQTRQIASPMPTDPNLEFRVTCPGESAEFLADNVKQVP
jgi:hypothetical protein